MSWYVDRLLPRIADVALSGAEFTSARERVCADLEGEVVEVGFGSGRNVPHYPASVTRVRAVDPSTVGRALAAARVAASRLPVDYVGLDGEQLPIDDGSIDHVLVTWTLCTIPDVDRALSEMRRVLCPGGSLHFVEHGLAPQPRVAKWQDRLTAADHKARQLLRQWREDIPLHVRGRRMQSVDVNLRRHAKHNARVGACRK